MAGERTLAEPRLKVTPWFSIPTLPNQWLIQKSTSYNLQFAPWCAPTPSNQCPYQVSSYYSLRFPWYSLDKILNVKVTTARSNVKSRSHHDIAYPQSLIDVHTKYLPSTPYRFRDIVQTKFKISRSLQHGQWSKQDHTMTLHTYTPQPTSLLSSAGTMFANFGIIARWLIANQWSVKFK